jgi:Protein of unknown function (DUF2924)
LRFRPTGALVCCVVNNARGHMKINVAKELAGLRELSTDQLREKYREVFGEAAKTRNKPFLFKRVAWRIQALAEGDLSERARQRAEELANDADLRLRMPQMPEASPGSMTAVHAFAVRDRLPMPGSLITREYKGRQIVVKVLEKGFEYNGEVYRSLSAIAKVVTGSHWNGFYFFGLEQGGGK